MRWRNPQLLGPGPSNPYPEATRALGGPLLGHLDPEFLKLMDDTCDMLRTVWGTTNRRTLPLSATGSGGMEAAFLNVVEPGDVVVVAVNGLFGERMCEVAARCGATVVPVGHSWGSPFDPERVVAAHRHPKVIAAVHAETSTGVLSDVAALGAAKGDALLLVDAVTSIGGSELEADSWGIDIGYAGTQKCLGVPPGLAPFVISDRAFAERVERPTSWYFDLALLGRYVGEAFGSRRTYHHTAPTAMVASLHAGLQTILEEGLPLVQARHRDVGSLLPEGLSNLGFELFADQGHRLPHLTTVRVPPAADSASVRRTLLEQHGIEIGAGVGSYSDSVWRIGMMGHNARPDMVDLVLGALAEVLSL